MGSASIDVLREDNYLYLLKTVYNDKTHNPMYVLRKELAVSLGVIASDDTMSANM